MLQFPYKNWMTRIICASLISLELFGEVIHAPNLEVISSKFDTLDEQALVVFDVDFTLIVPKDQVLQPAAEEYFQSFIKKLRAMKEEGAVLGSKVALQAEVKLVDQKSLLLLEQLKKRAVRTIVLTAMSSGQMGMIPSMEDWRLHQLKSLGIDLSWAFPKMPNLILDDFHEKNAFPVFKQGILSSARLPKGDVLVAFLNKLNFKPSKVLFIDDRMEYINSIELALEKAGIAHTSFHYTQAIDASKSFDKNLADYQLEHLLQEGEWLSDGQAKEKLVSY